MLRNKADVRSVFYILFTSALFVGQWMLGFHPVSYFLGLTMAISVAVMAHNHNHVPMWKNNTLNTITDYWITLFYGFPAFAWVPTHNRNHHHYNNREGDYTITYRYSEKNHAGTVLSYPAVSSYFQQTPITSYLQDLWTRNRPRFFQAVLQYVALGLWIVAALLIDWQKALLYVVIPQQVALFSILVFNYVQHVHADEESDYNHSRNFVGPFLNTLLFNNGFHTVHHERANVHWSELPAAHAKVAHLIDDSLNEPSFWGYIFRAYVIAPFAPNRGTKSMRLARIAAQANSATHATPKAHAVPRTVEAYSKDQ
jgi:beta-carotene hydroxylase